MFDSKFVQTTLTPILAIIGAFFGLMGTGIGVWNLWLNRKSHRFHIKVEVARGKGENEIIKKGTTETRVPRVRALTVRVVNNSYFPVTVTEVGLLMKASFWDRTKTHRIHIGDWNSSQERRIESRHAESFTERVGPSSAKDRTVMYHLLTKTDYPSIKFAIGAYAKLATGQTIKGGTKKKVREIAEEMLECIKANP